MKYFHFSYLLWNLFIYEKTILRYSHWLFLKRFRTGMLAASNVDEMFTAHKRMIRA